MIKNDLTGVRVGDKLWDAAEEEWVEVTSIGSATYPIVVRNKNGHFTACTLSGLVCTDSGTPRYYWDKVKIIPPPRPKRKVKKTVELWVNVYNLDICAAHKSKEDADINASKDRLGEAHHIIHEYEVEE